MDDVLTEIKRHKLFEKACTLVVSATSRQGVQEVRIVRHLVKGNRHYCLLPLIDGNPLLEDVVDDVGSTDVDSVQVLRHAEPFMAVWRSKSM